MWDWRKTVSSGNIVLYILYKQNQNPAKQKPNKKQPSVKEDLVALDTLVRRETKSWWIILMGKPAEPQETGTEHRAEGKETVIAGL